MKDAGATCTECGQVLAPGTCLDCGLVFRDPVGLAAHKAPISAPWKGERGNIRGRRSEGETYCDRIKGARRVAA